jgi:hypothetical protein
MRSLWRSIRCWLKGSCKRARLQACRRERRIFVCFLAELTEKTGTQRLLAAYFSDRIWNRLATSKPMLSLPCDGVTVIAFSQSLVWFLKAERQVLTSVTCGSCCDVDRIRWCPKLWLRLPATIPLAKYEAAQDGDNTRPDDISPDYSRCVGVDTAKACFIGVLLVSLGYCLFHWGIVPSLWIRKVTYDVKLTNLQSLPPRPQNRFKGKTRRLSS